MLRLSPPDFLRFSQAHSLEVVYGGGESNTAVSLANYGLPVEFVTRLPENDIARGALMELRRHGVGTRHIIFGGERLGIYFLENGAVSRGSKVVYDRAHSAMSEIRKGMVDWEKTFEGADWFHWSGITPAISQSAAEVCLESLEVADSMGLTISTDVNHRNKLWQYGKSPAGIMPRLVAYCDVIVSSKEEAELYFGIRPEITAPEDAEHSTTPEVFLSVCRQMKEKFPKAKKLVTTLRHSINASHHTWGAMLFDGETLFTSRRYNITHIVDRVGGGDSFAGGLIYGLKTYEDSRKALDFAVAASCLKHTIKGDVNLVTVEEVEKLMSGDGSGRVSR